MGWLRGWVLRRGLSTRGFGGRRIGDSSGDFRGVVLTLWVVGGLFLLVKAFDLPVPR